MKMGSRQGWGSESRRTIILCWLVAMAALMPVAHAAENPLVLGVFPRYKAAEATVMFTPLTNHLSERLGRKVILATAKDFVSFWKEVQSGRYDIVHYNQIHFIESAQTYKVIAYNQEFGQSTVAGAIYVRKDSGITSLSQLRGRSIMFGGSKRAMLSYIAPRFLLMQAGLKESDFTAKFAVSPPNALLAMYHQQADAAGGGDILINLPVVKKAINTQDLVLLAKTEPLLFLPWAVKRTMDTKLSDTIQSVLLGLGESDAGKKILQAARTTGTGRASDKDYEPHRKMIEAVSKLEGATK